MDETWGTVIGMSVAYVASLAGLVFAYIGYRRRKKESQSGEKE